MENIDLEESKNIGKNNSTVEGYKLNGATQFTIPALKAPKLLGGSQGFNKSSSSNINQFLLKLKDEQNHTTPTTNRFNIPQLQQNTFKTPELKIGQLTNVAEAQNGVIKTQQDQHTIATNVLEGKPLNFSLELFTKDADKTDDNIIDLTAALSTTRIGNNIPGTQKIKGKPEQFEIPFIDCDRTRPPTNEYCGIDISQAIYKHNLMPPSNLGKILSSKNNKFKSYRQEETQKTKKSSKHHIERFLFDTQSPDDMVLAALNRFTRP